MCNILNKLIGKITLKTKGSMLPIKSLNLYFKKSQEKSFQVLNLQNTNLVKFFVEEEEGLYKLKCLMSSNHLEETVVLASFDNKKDADGAMLEMRVASYGRSKFLLKIIIAAFILFQLFNSGSKKEDQFFSTTQQESSQTTVGATGTPEDIDNKFKEVQKKLAEINQNVPTYEQIDAERKRVAGEMNLGQEQAQPEEQKKQKDIADQWLDKLK